MDYVLTIAYDPDPECPTGRDGWTLVSFLRKSVHYQDPAEYSRPDGAGPADGALAEEFRAGLAFALDHFEHGEGRYSLAGEGPRCRWDASRLAGVLVWGHGPGELGARTHDDRAADARVALAEYNAWANGHVYGYSLAPADREVPVDSCWGFSDAVHISGTVGRLLGAGDRVWVAGPCMGLFDPRGLPGGVEVVDGFTEGADEAVVIHSTGGGHRQC